MRTPQEEFWSGKFGDEYIGRNRGDADLAANLRLFSLALRAAGRIDSCVELGANVGMNLRALKLLYPQIRLAAVEINARAAAELRTHVQHVAECSIFDWEPAEPVDLSLIKTVLIHINPELLPEVYDRLYRASRRYILICEYYNPTPVEISYRGHSERLFKRDFAGEIMDCYADLRLLDYGFAYRHDPVFLFDDQSWFLLEKVS